jgi:hypothetical protein
MLRVLIASLLVSLFAGAVAAETPPCALFTRADVVFAGRVVAIENAQKSEDLPAGTKKTRFQVTENFKGADNPTFTLFSTGETPLKKGQSWIVFAATDIVLKNFSIISRSEVTPEALADLKKIATTDEFGSISGRIVTTSAAVDLPKIRVRLTDGAKILTTGVGADGSFQFAVPSGGRFRVELEIPAKVVIKWPDTLLGVRSDAGEVTRFGYDVRTNAGDCSFIELEISD